MSLISFSAQTVTSAHKCEAFNIRLCENIGTLKRKFDQKVCKCINITDSNNDIV